MTKTLEHAFVEASKLPTEQQEALAAIILEELASDRCWTESFANSQDKLSTMADQALAEFRAGKTRPFEKDSDLSND